MSAAGLSFRHLLLALLIVAIWGCNFVAIKLALDDLPPLLLCTLRFVFVSLPAVFFLRRPPVPVGQLLTFGFSMFGCQFGFMFLGMKLGMPAGLASIVLQFQVFVTMALAAAILKERISFTQIAGALIAGAGFVVVGLHTSGDVTVVGFVCLLLAATSWGFANFTSKRLGKVNPLALVVWGSLVVPVPMAMASLAFEGPELIVRSLAQVGGTAVLSLAYIVYFSTLVAYSLWSWLLAHHPATTVTPFALLVPVVGLLSSAVMLGESMPAWKMAVAGLVMTGLALNVFGPKWQNGAKPVDAPRTSGAAPRQLR